MIDIMMFATTLLDISSFIMVQKKTATIATLFFLLCFSSAQQEQCSAPIGSNATEIASTPSRAQLFYLNVANPAPCTGSITSWRVCYYGPDDIPSNSLVNYWATYAVYRRTGTGSNVSYIRVSEIFRAVRTKFSLGLLEVESDGEISEGGFHCYTDSLDADDSPLNIQAGDILGACVFDPDGDIVILNTDIKITLPLDVVGEASGSEESLLQTSMAGCSRFHLPSDIPANQLTPIGSRRLHIYANIEGESMITHSVSTPITMAQVPLTSDKASTTGQAMHLDTETQTTNPTLPSQTPNLNTTGRQEGRTIGAIAGVIAGSTAGGLVILLLLIAITVTVVYIVVKWKILPGAVVENDSSVDKSQADDIITNVNPAYKSVRRQRVIANHDFEDVRDTSRSGVGETTTDTEEQESYYENQVFELKMEKNVAYQSSTIVQIPLHLNVEYCDESRKVNHQDTRNDEDYI